MIRSAFKIIFFTLCFSAPAIGCPLEGTWDTGFVPSGFGHTFLRLSHEFKCDGTTKLRAIQARGKMLQAMTEVIDRTGSYQLGAPVPGQDNTWEIDVKISTVTKRYLDPSTVELAGNRSGCQPADVQILIPFDMTGRNCDKAVYPGTGDIERAVVRIEGDKLYWSFFHGESALVIQKPNVAVSRKTVVDPDLVYLRQ